VRQVIGVGGRAVMGDGVRVRPARAEDIEAVRALLLAARLPDDGLEEQFGSAYAVAALAGGELVGAAGIEAYGAAGLLRSVVVAEAWRGTGLGRRMVADRLAWAEGRGLSEVYLLTSTAADFFARLGFSRIARDDVPAPVRASREFASVCPLSATVMTRGT